MISMGQDDSTSTISFLRSAIPWIFALFVLVGYGLFLRHLALHSNPKDVGDDHWVRLVFLFSSVEAIAFAAVGFIFGKEVNKTRAETAEKDAKQAKKVNKEMVNDLYGKLIQTSSPMTGGRTHTEVLDDISKSLQKFILKT